MRRPVGLDHGPLTLVWGAWDLRRIGSAYVHGMSHARGEFIFIMDADLSHHVRGPHRVVIASACIC